MVEFTWECTVDVLLSKTCWPTRSQYFETIASSGKNPRYRTLCLCAARLFFGHALPERQRRIQVQPRISSVRPENFGSLGACLGDLAYICPRLIWNARPTIQLARKKRISRSKLLCKPWVDNKCQLLVTSQIAMLWFALACKCAHCDRGLSALAPATISGDLRPVLFKIIDFLSKVIAAHAHDRPSENRFESTSYMRMCMFFWIIDGLNCKFILGPYRHIDRTSMMHDSMVLVKRGRLREFNLLTWA